MGLFDWLFQKHHKTPSDNRAISLDLDSIMESVHSEASHWEEEEIQGELLIARLADCCRDAQLDPAEPEVAAKHFAAWNPMAQQRMAMCVEMLIDVVEEDDLAHLFQDTKGAGLFHHLAGLIDATEQLSPELIHQSPLRVEEFARHFIARLGAQVEGEAPQESQARLERLDYGTLLAEAERARSSAEEQLEHLRKLQEDLDARFQPRGKW